MALCVVRGVSVSAADTRTRQAINIEKTAKKNIQIKQGKTRQDNTRQDKIGAATRAYLHGICTGFRSKISRQGEREGRTPAHTSSSCTLRYLGRRYLEWDWKEERTEEERGGEKRREERRGQGIKNEND
jgi:hypothetical protein